MGKTTTQVRVMSYKTLRKLIGLLALLVTPVCVLGELWGGNGVTNSISASYGTNMRDWLEGIMAVTGAFLITYKGYDWKDHLLSWIMGIGALGVALFPCCNGTSSITTWPTAVTSVFHACSAAVFFIGMSFMSYFQFSKGTSKWNKFYKGCGIALLIEVIAFALIACLTSWAYGIISIEAVMLCTFALPWFVKGKQLN